MIEPMKVLQVTNARGSFFENQLGALDAVDVAYDVSTPRTGADGDRTAIDYLRFLPDLVRRSGTGYDLVHVNYGLLGPFAVAQRTRPIVLTLWGSDVMGDYPLVNGASRYAIGKADAVVAPSRALAAQLDIVPDIVPFGIDTDLFRPIPRETARERIGWPTDEAIALFPYDPAREVKDFPRAERVVEAAESDVTLRTISGVPYEEMPDYLNAADLVLVTSEREAGPMVLKEAAACNVPTVSTDVGFARELVADVDNAAVATTTEGLAAAVDDVLATDRRSNGRDSADVISIESMGMRLRAVYERVVT